MAIWTALAKAAAALITIIVVMNSSGSATNQLPEDQLRPDLDRAIELGLDRAWVFASRGLTYRW